MTDAPETHYTRSADGTNLAYQVSGDRPLDLLFLHGTDVPVDLLSEDPGFLRLRRPPGTHGGHSVRKPTRRRQGILETHHRHLRTLQKQQRAHTYHLFRAMCSRW
jgi:hypothetical protein